VVVDVVVPAPKDNGAYAVLGARFRGARLDHF